MTPEQRAASIRRHAVYLLPGEAKALMPTDAETQACERIKAIGERMRADSALRDQVNHENLTGWRQG